MKNKINISIPQPCHENWQLMTSLEKGRFCAACKKNVYDFTRSSDKEIAQAFKKQGNLCGRFNASQLNRDLAIPKEKNSIWVTAASVIFSFIGIGSQQSLAQTNNSIEQHEAQQQTKVTNPDSGEIELNGIVADSIGSLPGTTITDISTNMSVLTDIDGKFSIKTLPGTTLRFSFVGMETKEIKYNIGGTYNIQLIPQYNPDELALLGAIYVRPNFVTRIFRSVGSIFKKKS